MNRRHLISLVNNFHERLDNNIQFLPRGASASEYTQVLNNTKETFLSVALVATQYQRNFVEKLANFLTNRFYGVNSLSMQQLMPDFESYSSCCKLIMEEHEENMPLLYSRILHHIFSEPLHSSAQDVAQDFVEYEQHKWQFISKPSGGFFSVRKSTEHCLKFLQDNLYINPRFPLIQILNAITSHSEFNSFFKNNTNLLLIKRDFMYVLLAFIEEFEPQIYFPTRQIFVYEDDLAGILKQYGVDPKDL